MIKREAIQTRSTRDRIITHSLQRRLSIKSSVLQIVLHFIKSGSCKRIVIALPEEDINSRRTPGGGKLSCKIQNTEVPAQYDRYVTHHTREVKVSIYFARLTVETPRV